MRYLNDVFLVIIDFIPGDDKKVKAFRISDIASDIIAEINKNKRKAWHRAKAFHTWYEADKYLREVMDFEEQFDFDIHNGRPIELNRTYKK